MTKRRNIYLKMKSIEAAKTDLFKEIDITKRRTSETLSVTDAVGRVLHDPVFAKQSSPPFHAAAMDGVAVSAKSTYGASEMHPKTLAAGSEAIFVNTGHVMPAHTDAVIMIEDIQVVDAHRVEIEAPAFPWQHVRRLGEDIVATQLLFPRHHRVTPYCLGALITGGISVVEVIRQPHLFILPTGSELVDHQTLPADLSAGRVIESNTHVLGKLAEQYGARYTRHAIVPDNPEKIQQIVAEAAQNDQYDIILVVGGSSAGSEDYARDTIAALGKVLVHGVAMMPGKPTVIGAVGQKAVFGIPGYPVSAIMAFEQFIAPLISTILGQPEAPEETISVRPTKKIAVKLGMEQFIRVKLGRVDDRVVATPLPRGAGTITSLTEADGIIRIPSNVEGIHENETVSARLLKPRESVEHTIVAVGSHDNTIDLLSDLIRAKSTEFELSSSHVGSMGGLMAVRNRLCHFAGTHLLDPADGSYNISYIQKYLPDTPVRLVRLVEREQGLVVASGNPKGIAGINDLQRDDIIFINRQSGSGTRVLLDYHLNRLGIDPGAISGYENEEFTHMAVAVAVLGQTADAGLAIHAAAAALELDFIPIAKESYDLVIPERFMETPHIQLILEAINSREFIDRVSALGGYHTENTGTTVWKSH